MFNPNDPLIIPNDLLIMHRMAAAGASAIAA